MWFYLLRGTEKQKRGAYLCQYSILPSFLQHWRCEILKINPRLRATLMCSIFLVSHSQITLQYMVQCLCFSFIYVRKKRESTTSYIFVNIESFVIYVNDPVFPQKGNLPASANLCHRPADSFMNKKMISCWKCFQVIGYVASKDEWVRDVCHFRRVSKTDSMPRPPLLSNSPPPDSTQITTFKSEAAKVLSAAPPWSDQKLVTDKINFHFSSHGRVWSSGS